MRFSISSKLRGLLSLIAIITIVSAFMLNGLFFRTTATHAVGGQSTSSTKGILTPVKSVDDSKSATPLFSRGVRHLHQGNSQAVKSPSSAGSQLGTTNSGTLLQKFNGTSSLDSAKTNFNAEF